VTRDRVYSASFPPFAYASYPPSLASVLHVDPVAHKMMCIEPNSLLEQERNFIKVFAKARASAHGRFGYGRSAERGPAGDCGE
jgi:hypothetical protein